MEQEKKSANKQWKESKTTLSFKEWIDRENKKKEDNQQGNFLPFGGIPATDVVKDTLTSAQQEVDQIAGYRTQSSNKTVFGIDKTVLVFSGLIIVGAIGFYAYNKLKDKK